MAKRTTPEEPTMSFEELAASLEKQAENFETQSDDVVGYWDADKSPIVCVPKGVRLLDGSQDSEKPSVLILARLVAPTALMRRNEETREWEFFVGSPGDNVGIWGKWGMKAVRNCAGVKTYIKKTGATLKLKNRRMPMQLFEVKTDKSAKPCPLPILEDARDESRHAKTFLDGSRSDTDAPF